MNNQGAKTPLSPYTAHKIRWPGLTWPVGQNFRNRPNISQSFPVSRKDSGCVAFPRVLSETVPFLRKASHWSPDHTLQSSSEVVWRDRPRCDAH
jgi:hypothetical protein